MEFEKITKYYFFSSILFCETDHQNIHGNFEKKTEIQVLQVCSTVNIQMLSGKSCVIETRKLSRYHASFIP